MKTSLEARVIARNIANSQAMELHKQAAAALASFVGKKVLKAGGEMMEKIKGLFSFPSSPGLHVYRYRSEYTLTFCVKASVQSESGWADEEAYVNVGSLEHGVLKEILPVPTLRTDYNAKEIIELRKIAEDLKEKARNAESACHPFGLFDR